MHNGERIDSILFVHLTRNSLVKLHVRLDDWDDEEGRGRVAVALGNFLNGPSHCCVAGTSGHLTVSASDFEHRLLM